MDISEFLVKASREAKEIIGNERKPDWFCFLPRYACVACYNFGDKTLIVKGYVDMDSNMLGDRIVLEDDVVTKISEANSDANEGSPFISLYMSGAWKCGARSMMPMRG